MVMEERVAGARSHQMSEGDREGARARERKRVHIYVTHTHTYARAHTHAQVADATNPRALPAKP